MSDDKPTKPFNLNMHTARLLMREPFFAALSRRIDKIATTAIPTAGVRVTPDSAQFELMYNPEFMGALSDDHKLGILKHEFYHLIFEHVTSRKPEGVNHKVWNICAALAIHSHLQGELPDWVCMPGGPNFEEMPLGQSAEGYLANFPERPLLIY